MKYAELQLKYKTALEVYYEVWDGDEHVDCFDFPESAIQVAKEECENGRVMLTVDLSDIDTGESLEISGDDILSIQVYPTVEQDNNKINFNPVLNIVLGEMED